MSGTPRSSPFAARPRRRPSRRPRCQRNSQSPFRLGTQTNRLLKAASARGAPVAQQPADRLRARSQRIGSLIDRGSSDTVGNVSRTFSKRSRPAFPDAAFLGISESRSRRAASASTPARRPRSWWRPRSPTFRRALSSPPLARASPLRRRRAPAGRPRSARQRAAARGPDGDHRNAPSATTPTTNSASI
jgi:hypothetical protein